MTRRTITLAVASTTLVVGLSACGSRDSVASRSARALREAQARGEPVTGHAHGHNGIAAEGDQATPTRGSAAAPEPRHEGAATPAEEHRHDTPAGTPASHHRRDAPARASAPVPAPDAHAGHAAPPQPAPPRSTPPRPSQAQPAPPDPHAGHQPPAASVAGQAPPVGVAPAALGNPASTLQPDPLDAPAPTAVAEATRAAAAAASASSHELAPDAYRQIDAGRAPEPPPGTEHDHHDPGDGGSRREER